MDRLPDYVVRKEAFAWLERRASGNDAEYSGSLEFSRSELEQGFVIGGHTVPLVAPQGIHIPKASDGELPLTITTIVNGPYRDEFIDEHTLSYKYKKTDPNLRENRGLRELMQKRIPLIYLYGRSSRYIAVWPIFVIDENPSAHHFLIRAESRDISDYWASEKSVPSDFDTKYGALRREHRTREVRVRVHQQAFRTRVLAAYGNKCSLCRLKHPQLLDAAHITPDSNAFGEPLVSNGLTLCKIHHAAFDKLFLGIRPNYTVHIRQDLLDEFDGPVLQHALKELHNKNIHVPASANLKPDTNRLEERYARFLGK